MDQKRGIETILRGKQPVYTEISFSRYYGSLGVQIESYLGSEQLAVPMIMHYFRYVNEELRHSGYLTSLDFCDSSRFVPSRKDTRKRAGRKRKSAEAGPSTEQEDGQEYSQNITRIYPTEEVIEDGLVTDPLEDRLLQ